MTEPGPYSLGDVQLIPLSRIKPYDKNPRRRPQKAVEQVAKSIRKFGWQQPIVVDADMVIIIGHTRYAAARSLGESKAPVIIAGHLSPEEARALRVADNRTRDYTTWDFPLLISELDELDEDFADVLDLADWQGIISQYEDSREDALPELDPDVSSHLTEGFSLTVTFDTQESADKAGPAILDLPGVVNIAHSRK